MTFLRKLNVYRDRGLFSLVMKVKLITRSRENVKTATNVQGLKCQASNKRFKPPSAKQVQAWLLGINAKQHIHKVLCS